MTLTAERLRELLHYDPETGVFTWLRGRNCNAMAGDVAGTVNPKGYVVIFIDRRPYRAHRLAYLYMMNRWPPDEVDHRNGERADNRWTNLRPATRAENARNRRMRSTKAVPFKGVSWSIRDRRFFATIRVNGKQVFLPYRRTAEEAHADYVAAAIKHFGEFARTA